MNTKDLQSLLSRAANSRPSALSVYLNVDQADAHNLNRGFEARLKTMTSSLLRTVSDAAEAERLTKAAHHISDFVSVYDPAGRSLVIFFDESDGFFWHTDLGVSLRDDIRWDRELFLEPLARSLDELERYGVVLVDRNSMRLFTVFLGKIDEVVHKRFSTERVRHIKTSGTDHIGSASGIQRRADEQIHLNLRHVVEEVDSLVQGQKITRLIFAGTPEITAELHDLFPKRLALCVIGNVDIRMNAPASEVLAATQQVARQYEESTEVQKVSELVTAAAKREQAVVGLGHTLKALNSDRVWELIYAADFSTPGYECTKCNALFSIHDAACPYCAGAVHAVGNVVERAVGHAANKGARIEYVTGEAAASLYSAGGIGAFLKTRKLRTGSGAL